MNKKYKAIFFDWDGTAVTSRTAPVEDAVVAMKPLLQQGTKLVIVSGTTYDKIAGGKFHTYFTEEEQKNLFFGLGRGAYNYHITDGRHRIQPPKLLQDRSYGGKRPWRPAFHAGR